MASLLECAGGIICLSVVAGCIGPFCTGGCLMEFSGVNTARLAATAGLCAALIGGGLSVPAVAFAVPNSDYQEVSVALDENTLDDAFAVTSDDRALAASPNDGGSGEDANTGVEDAVAQVGDVTYSSLPDALAAACESSGTVTLLKSVELSAPLEITQGSATIDLAGFTIKPAAETINYPLSVKAGASLGNQRLFCGQDRSSSRWVSRASPW